MSYKDHKIKPDMSDWSDPKYLILVKSHNYLIDPNRWDKQTLCRNDCKI